jgi:hypothetical protein
VAPCGNWTGVSAESGRFGWKLANRSVIWSASTGLEKKYPCSSVDTVVRRYCYADGSGHADILPTQRRLPQRRIKVNGAIGLQPTALRFIKVKLWGGDFHRVLAMRSAILQSERSSFLYVRQPCNSLSGGRSLFE